VPREPTPRRVLEKADVPPPPETPVFERTLLPQPQTDENPDVEPPPVEAEVPEPPVIPKEQPRDPEDSTGRPKRQRRPPGYLKEYKCSKVMARREIFLGTRRRPLSPEEGSRGRVAALGIETGAGPKLYKACRPSVLISSAWFFVQFTIRRNTNLRGYRNDRSNAKTTTIISARSLKS
jgi:hypothetical protein